ncbi:MAG: DUF5522 domain-containing protein [Pedobacter sp.]|nr:DUF5522 domain-containing protein [Pedobacter sp.]MDQ8053723.1 DUF5522 domain-containing protein [Pedobacter sp.]
MEEGIDFYFNEQGLMVLTAAFLKKRGYCCKNRCTNCPWNYGKGNKQSPSNRPDQTQDRNDSTNQGN